MNKQSQRNVESIFFEVIEKKPRDRDAFLEKSCGDNDALRQEVRALLDAQESPDTYLQRPVVDLAATNGATIDEREGSQIGRYKLLEKLGEGGFGLVFMAEQTSPVRRRVALKIIKPGMESKEVVARFEAERQALAMMDHPNIAKVLDGGTTDSGRPYFVMELVKGASITEYCDANRLPTRARLELFQQVCRAIQHAHQKGIIHRDLKPNNVMVTLHDGVPIPKVIDFGVSKALSQPLTERTLFTRYGQIVGTPQYMSPEQAEMSGLDVDTRSDVYSLGVLLYELLTGNTPFDADELREAGFDGMRRIIREQEPVKPSTALSTLKEKAATLIATQRSLPPNALRQAVAGDLDWIAMKCLEKNRNRRYETANDLNRDIDRHLADEPIAAGPPSLAYQLKKFYHRNRAAATTAAAIGTILVIGITTTTVAWAQEIRIRQLAVEQGQIAEANADKARNEAEKAKRAARRAQSSLDAFTSLLARASPDPEKGSEVRVSDLLKSFATDLDSAEFDDKKVELEVRLTLAKALRRFSMFDDESEQYARAEKIAREVFPPESLELAEFLLERARRIADLPAVPLLDEALAGLDSTSRSRVLEVEIYLEYGRHLAWDKVVQARSKFEKACELARHLSEQEKARLEQNPFAELARHLEYWHKDFANAERASKEAVAFSQTYGGVPEEVDMLLLSRKLGRQESNEELLQKARQLAFS